MKFINTTVNKTELMYDQIDCDALSTSYYVFTQARKINIFCTIFITLLGLIGNSLTMSVYLNKRFRINSSCVFLLCMAFSDGLFLILHFFEG